MKLPFTLQNVLETMIDRPIGLYSNFPSSNEYRRFSEITLLQDGKILRSGNDVGTWGMWGVLNGVLRLMSEKGYLSIEFRTLETRNESVYAVGRNVQEPIGAHRVILQIKQPITTFGVCISSHVNYEKVAVPRILKSLEGDGFDMSRVLVVIGSDSKNGGLFRVVDPELGVMSARKREDIFGLMALKSVPPGKYPYWLLLHDTCEVTNGFTTNVANIDVGLNPDMVLLRPLAEKQEFGLYESQFATELENMAQDISHTDYFGLVTQRAEVVVNLDSLFKKEPERDVYGMGVKRETVNFHSIGLKKFRAREMDTSHP